MSICKKSIALYALCVVLSLCAASSAMAEQRTLTLPSNLKEICDESFIYTKEFSKVVLPDGLLRIGERAFAYSSITTINLPDSATYIADSAFEGCDALKTVEAVGGYARDWALRMGYIKSKYPESEHPYPPYETESWEYSVQGAYALDVTFSEETDNFFQSDGPSDILYVYDGSDNIVVACVDWREIAGRTVRVPGDRFKITLESNVVYGDENCYGFKVTNVVAVEKPKKDSESDFAYIIDSDQTIAIAGYSGDSDDLIIPASINGLTVKRIADGAFLDRDDLTGQLIIPDTVESIGDNAFKGCCGLSGRLTIPEGVKRIGNSAFESCYELTGELAIPDSVEYIGDYAFCDCLGLTGGISIPNGVRDIGNNAFRDCYNFTGSIAISDGVTRIGNGAFRGCSGLTGNLAIPSSVTSIGNDAFRYCDNLIGNLIIPNSVTSVGEYAFHDCDGLSGSIVIPSSLRYIGDSAFYISWSDYSNITFYVEKNSRAERYCVKEDIPYKYISDTKPTVTFAIDESVEGKLGFSGAVEARGEGATISILHIELFGPDTMQDFEKYAVYYRDAKLSASNIALSSIPAFDLGTTVERARFECEDERDRAKYAPFDSIDLSAPGTYYVCLYAEDSRGLQSDPVRATFGVQPPHHAAHFSYETVYGGEETYIKITGYSDREGSLALPAEIDGLPVREICDHAFSGCAGLTGSLIIPSGVRRIGDGAFAGCTGFAGGITISQSVTSIGESAFEGCQNLSGALVIPSGVTNIADRAFKDCQGLSGRLVIPNGVINIGDSAFEGCEGLNGLLLPNNASFIGAQAFKGCDGFTGGLAIPGSVESIGDYAFEGCGFTGGLSISEGVTNIGTGAFKNCDGLTGAIVIPKSVKNIGDYAFQNCSGFTGGLTISYGVTNIGICAFQHCTGLTGNLVIPNSVTSIGSGAFLDCYGIDGSLVLSNNLTSIGGGAFKWCSGITGSLTIPDGVTSIGKNAFERCGFTGSLTIPDGVTSIGGNAFKGCSGFTSSLTIPDGVTSIGGNAFKGCSGFTGSLTIPNSVTNIEDGAFVGCFFTTYNINADAVKPIVSFSLDRSVEGWLGFRGSAEARGEDYSIRKLHVEIFGPDTMEDAEKYAVYYRDATLDAASIDLSRIPAFEIGSEVNRAGFECEDEEDYAKYNPYDSIDISKPGTYYVCLYAEDSRGLQNAPLTETFTIQAPTHNEWFEYETVQGEAETYVVITGYTGPDGPLALPSQIDGLPVREIGSGAFRNRIGLTGDLVIPDSVTSIYYGAFEGCTGLERVTIPSSVTYMGGSMFSGCTGLKHAVINGSVIEITNMFANCSSLESFSVPSGVKRVNSYDFSGCESLRELTLPGSVEQLNMQDGYRFTLNSLTVMNPMLDLQARYFASPEGLTIRAYSNAYALRDFCAANGMRFAALDEATYEGFTLTLSTDGSYWCVNGFAPSDTYADSVAIPSEYQWLPIREIAAWAFANETLTDVTVPDSVVSIGAGAFDGCIDLSGVSLPDGLFSIGRMAFRNCTGLRSITLPDSVRHIGESAFGGCTGLARVMLPDGLETISAYTFEDCASLNGVALPEELLRVEFNAFKGCTSLTSLLITKNVYLIGIGAFEGCQRLTLTVYVGGYAQEYAQEHGIRHTVLYETPASDFERAEYAGVNGVFITRYTGKQKVVIVPDSIDGKPVIGVDNISGGYYYGKVEKVTLGANVQQIAPYAFSDMYALKSVVIPTGCSWYSVGQSAFKNCSSLLSLRLPNALYKIESAAFAGCVLLAKLYIGPSVRDIAGDAFSGCIGLTIYGVDGSYAQTWANEHGIPFATGFEAVCGHAVYDDIYTNHQYADYDERMHRARAVYARTCEGCGAGLGIEYGPWEDKAHRYGGGVCACGRQPKVYGASILIYELNGEENGVIITGCTGRPVALEIPASINGCPITDIRAHAFAGCASLIKLAFADVPLEKDSGQAQISIGENAFENCVNLENVSFGNNVASIDDDAFLGCAKLGNVGFSDRLVSIGANVFYGCPIGQVSVPGGAVLGENAFSGATETLRYDASLPVPALTADHMGASWTYSGSADGYYISLRDISEGMDPQDGLVFSNIPWRETSMDMSSYITAYMNESSITGARTFRVAVSAAVGDARSLCAMDEFYCYDAGFITPPVVKLRGNASYTPGSASEKFTVAWAGVPYTDRYVVYMWDAISVKRYDSGNISMEGPGVTHRAEIDMSAMEAGHYTICVYAICDGFYPQRQSVASMGVDVIDPSAAASLSDTAISIYLGNSGGMCYQQSGHAVEFSWRLDDFPANVGGYVLAGLVSDINEGITESASGVSRLDTVTNGAWQTVSVDSASLSSHTHYYAVVRVCDSEGGVAVQKTEKVFVLASEAEYEGYLNPGAYDIDRVFCVQNGYEISNRLLWASSHMAKIAYNEAECAAALENLEFYSENLISYNYGTVKHSEDTVAFMLGWKYIIDSDGQPCRLYAVIIRGTQGNDEWISNFNVGTGTMHSGFSVAAIDVKNHLADFIMNTTPQNEAMDCSQYKIWITGHSRGAAVANLLAGAYLTPNRFVGNSWGFEYHNIYAYTFACPNVIRGGNDTSTVKNYNIGGDIIPYVPLSEWGYKRYGVTMTTDETPAGLNQQGATSYIASVLATSFPTVADYNAAWSRIGSKLKKETSLSLIKVVRILISEATSILGAAGNTSMAMLVGLESPSDWVANVGYTHDMSLYNAWITNALPL